MNRETWLRILQIAVVAPFIYKISEKERGYFRLGLKLVAGGIVLSNLPALLKELEPVIKAATKLTNEAALINAQEKANAVDGEIVSYE